jgi:uncharacterized protein YxjI
MLDHVRLRDDPGWTLYRLPGQGLPAGSAIVDVDGVPVFNLDGGARCGVLVLHDLTGVELFRIQPPAVRLRDALTIQSGADVAAIVTKVLEIPLREQFRVEVADGHTWSALGGIAAEDYQIKEGGQLVATVIPSPAVPPDGYSVRIAATVNAALVLMVVLAIDGLTRPRAT